MSATIIIFAMKYFIEVTTYVKLVYVFVYKSKFQLKAIVYVGNKIQIKLCRNGFFFSEAHELSCWQTEMPMPGLNSVF